MWLMDVAAYSRYQVGSKLGRMFISTRVGRLGRLVQVEAYGHIAACW